MTSFLDLMHDADPARRHETMGPERRAAVLEHATASDPHPTRSTRRTHLARAAAAVAVAATLAVGTITFEATTGSAAEARADEVLGLAAINATDPAIAPGQYWEVTEDEAAVRGATFILQPHWMVHRRRVAYYSATGDLPDYFVDFRPTKAEQVSGLPASYPLDEHPERQIWTTQPRNLEEGSWQAPNKAFFASLSRDETTLRNQLHAAVGDRGRDPHEHAWNYGVDLLRNGYVPANVRAATFRMLASIEGTRVVEENVEVNGRRGVVIGRPSTSQDSYEIVVDPDGGEVLATRIHYAHRPDTWDSRTSFSRRLVDRVPADVVKLACREDQHCHE